MWTVASRPAKRTSCGRLPSTQGVLVRRLSARTVPDQYPDGHPVVTGITDNGDGTANFNVLIGGKHADPISGSMPHRSYLCEVERLEDPSPPRD